MHYQHLLVWLLILVGSTGTQAQKLRTYFLGPKVPSYDWTYAYYYGVVSNDVRLCETGLLCDDKPMLNSHTKSIYHRCGFHSFRDVAMDHIFSSNVTNLPHRTRMSLYIKTRSDLALIDCILDNGNSIACLPPADKEAMDCVANLTQGSLPHRVCMPWWGLTVIIGVACAGIAIAVLFLRERCRDRFRFLAIDDIPFEILPSEDIVGDGYI